MENSCWSKRKRYFNWKYWRNTWHSDWTYYCWIIFQTDMPAPPSHVRAKTRKQKVPSSLQMRFIGQNLRTRRPNLSLSIPQTLFCPQGRPGASSCACFFYALSISDLFPSLSWCSDDRFWHFWQWEKCHDSQFVTISSCNLKRSL